MPRRRTIPCRSLTGATSVESLPTKHAVFDHGRVLVHAVVVAGDRARADVDAFADLRVAQIGEMVRLRTFAQLRFLGLDEVADVRAFSDFAAGAQM